MTSADVVLPQIVVEIGFTVGAITGSFLQLDDPTRGKLNTGTLADATTGPVWTDVSAYVLELSVNRGSSRITGPVISYDGGTASIIFDNADGRFDPANLLGPYVASGATQVTAMRAIRIRAIYASVTYDLWRGFTDTWDVTWFGPAYSESTVLCSDAFKVFAGIDRIAVAPAGLNDTLATRVGRILDTASWAAADRNLVGGSSLLQATTLSGDVLTELQSAAQSELGELWVDGGGRVNSRGRQGLLTDTRSTVSQGTFGDTYAEFPYDNVTLSSDDATFYTQVRVTAAGSSNPQFVRNTSTEALYYPKTFVPDDDPIVTTDSEALNMANWLLFIAATPEKRITGLQIKPWEQPADLYPQVLGRELGDRITVIRRPPGGASVINTQQFIRGITHTVSIRDDGQAWTTGWVTQSADKFANFFTLNSATLGVLNVGGALAY